MGPRLLSLWGIVTLLCLYAPCHAALQTWSPGGALSLNNGQSPKEYAYTTRRLGRTFTVEFWVRGQTPTGAPYYFSVAHPNDDNLVLIGPDFSLLGLVLFDMPGCPSPTEWCHQAVAVDVAAHPQYAVAHYINGTLHQQKTGQFPRGSPAAYLDEDTLSVVLGADQDEVLGGWDEGQMLSGQFDEVRLWNVVRTGAEIAAAHRLSLSPVPPGVTMYYRFDDPANATAFADSAAPGDAAALRVGDATAGTAACGAAEAAPSAGALAVSTAPVCAAAGAAARVRAQAGAAVRVPVGALYCGGAGAVTIGAVRGGTLRQNGRDVAGQAVPGAADLEFTAAAIAADTGFDYTVQDAADASTAAGSVAVLLNRAPALPRELAIVGTEDLTLRQWIPVDDPDHDMISLELVQAPAVGTGRVDADTRRRYVYDGGRDAFGANLSTAVVRARDVWGAASAPLTVVVSLKPTQDKPQLVAVAEYQIYEGQELPIPFEVVSVDGKDSFVTVSDWPSAAEGLLRAKEGAREWAIDYCAVSSKLQWATGYAGFSSEYVGYEVAEALGKPQLTVYGNSKEAWAPSTVNGGCVNRAAEAERATHFYTEFLEFTFDTPMYMNTLLLVENYGSDRVARVLVPSDRDPAQWKPIYVRNLRELEELDSVHKFTVFAPEICDVLWPVDRVRVEVDTCHRKGWYEIDAVQMRGGVVQPVNVLNATTRLSFAAAPGFTGDVVFGLTATDCAGSFAATSDTQNMLIRVLPPPYTTDFEAVSATWVPVDAAAGYNGSRVDHVRVLRLPRHGSLRYGGAAVTALRADLGGAGARPEFEYRADSCEKSGADSFVVQLGSEAVVTVRVAACAYPSMVAAVLVPVLCVALLLLGAGGALWWFFVRGKSRDNSCAPKDSGAPVCVLFTDIQASTALWGAHPEAMSAALDVHHAVIRKLIKKHKCYEVKTVGDCFMVATRDPKAGVALALGIQDAFYEYDWGTEDIDDVYKDQTGYEGTAAAYRRLWNGLRVRVGVHYGTAQAIFDEVTRGYDYYGTVVNAASRIESVAHGGQVVVSEAVLNALAGADLDYTSVSLGVQQLRGLPAPLTLVQLSPERFQERQFPPLRLDKAEEDDEDPSDDNASRASEDYPAALQQKAATHALVRNGTLSAAAAVNLVQEVFYSIQALLCMVKGDMRKKMLKDLCKQWHIQVSLDNEPKLFGRLAMQVMSSVVTLSGRAAGSRPNSVASRASRALVTPRGKKKYQVTPQ